MRKVASVLWIACGLILLAGAALSAERNGPPSGNSSAAPVKYALPFDNNPYLPSEARSSFTQFFKPADVPTAAYCGQCHANMYREWRESAHANSFRTPWYTKNVNLLIGQKGIAFSRHGEGCHNPIALFSGSLTTGSTVARPFDDEGVTCIPCHAIERTQATRGLGSYVPGRPTALLDALGRPIPGMPAPAEILAHLDRHRSAVGHTVMSTPEFCGSCHKANLPRTLNDYKWLRAFTTYDEWQQSGWSGQTPLCFFKPPIKACQNCHMPLVAGAGGLLSPVVPTGRRGPRRLCGHRHAGASPRPALCCPSPTPDRQRHAVGPFRLAARCAHARHALRDAGGRRRWHAGIQQPRDTVQWPRRGRQLLLPGCRSALRYVLLRVLAEPVAPDDPPLLEVAVTVGRAR